MKKIIFLVAIIFGTGNVAKAEVFSNWNSENEDPICFSERGIDFYVFPNGTFDFNTNNQNNSDSNYYKSIGRRSQEVDNQNFNNYGIRIENDDFGRIRRVGNVFINYDYMDRVNRIGSVFLKYNRFALVQVGGLHLVYNHFGDIINQIGNVKYGSNYGNYYYNNYQNQNYNAPQTNQENNNYYYKKRDSKILINQSKDSLSVDRLKN